MHHYLECGLSNVHLVNGFPFLECINDLHAAIGKLLVQKPGSLDGSEIKFLRREMGMTQKVLGEKLGISSRTVCRWEKYRGRPKSELDVLLRALYLRFVGCVCSMASLLRVMSALDDEPWVIILECHHHQWYLSPKKNLSHSTL